MDPITLILQSLASKVVGDAAGLAAGQLAKTEACLALKARIQKIFGGNATAETVLVEYEKDPQVYSEPLKKVLVEAEVDKDDQILALLQQIQAQGSSSETVINIGQGAKGIIGQTVTGATINGTIG